MALRAEIEIGTACMFSSRFCAVTTTSSMPSWVKSFCALTPLVNSMVAAIFR
ncbi:MAG: hypothetical protein IPO61_21275 [Gammaproteobacteria bacterium]|nr:hypothetical protein [Gammaproteobacteria bacterium]